MAAVTPETAGDGAWRGKAVVITGSTDGVGRAVAAKLAAQGAHVLLHGRDEARGAQAVAALNSLPGSGGAIFHRADLSSLAEVERFAAALTASHPTLDLLINNAGVGSGPPDDRTRRLSEDGFELRFAVNYLAHFLLSARLLPCLARAAAPRIVNVASLGQQEIDFDDVMLERSYSGTRAYRQSKLAQILGTVELAARLPADRITVNSLHPATFMDTHMVRQAGNRPLSTVEQGAAAIFFVASSPSLRGRSGLFFDGQREARALAQAYDPDARRQLFQLSLRLTGLHESAFRL